ncbi:phage tail protein [Cellulomonas sp. 179-A 4D5 NHS]|uniref:phage tail protein n=1 Tax=Cellulomonas sp. 179-A 4D5 NHS TaxID=3142378 RepID=UPI0039A14B46
MRGTVPGLTNPVALVDRLPAVYQDEDFVRRFVGAFDEVLAPVLLTIDRLECYVDPRLAPPDFLSWVGEWVGIELDDAWGLAQSREIVADAASLHRRRGTRPGIEDAVRLALGLGLSDDAGARGDVEVVDSGGTRWSASPGAALPGTPELALTVRVRVPDPTTVDIRRLDRVVSAVKPAHVPHTVVVEACTEEEPC